jgi:hypothetical protein
MTDYFLRTTDKDGKAYGGFQWPMRVGAIVETPDWDAKPECGHGLHGLKDGLGDASHLSSASDAVWWIVKADDAVDLGGKHKFPRCEVVALGDRATLTAALYALRPGPIHYLTLTGGYRAKLTGGDDAKLTGGDYATLTGGYYATLTGGDGATLTGGDNATLTGGHDATLTGGYYATLTGGDNATLTGGYRAKLTGGDDAKLTGGDGATMTGGDGATMIFLRWIGGRHRVLTAYVGECGIEAGKAYRANDDFTAVVQS